MTPIKFYIGLLVALLLGIGVSMFGGHYRQLVREASLAEQRGRVMESASVGVQEGIDLDEFQAGYRAAIQSSRDTFQQTVKEAKRNEPETADRAVRPVPDSVRNAFRERRLARERLGCPAGKCGQDDEADAAAQREDVLR